ncbi:MAG: FdhD protein, partial [Pseudomonadota bacterium]|nr:FdhD protein [Pseudomonadota bacterium]
MQVFQVEGVHLPADAALEGATQHSVYHPDS